MGPALVTAIGLGTVLAGPAQDAPVEEQPTQAAPTQAAPSDAPEDNPSDGPSADPSDAPATEPTDAPATAPAETTKSEPSDGSAASPAKTDDDGPADAPATNRTDAPARKPGAPEPEKRSEPSGPEKTTAPMWAPRRKEKWITRLRPEHHMGELGVFGGINVLSTRHELFQKDASDPRFQGWKELDRPAGDFGMRFGYYPLPHLGVEGDFALMPAKLKASGQRALVWTTRAHVVGQLGFWSVTPFVLFGGGALGVTSDRSAIGKDRDPLVYWGAGVKFYVHRYLQVRLETRDNISSKQGLDTGMTNHWEILAGLSVTLGRKKLPEPAPEPKPKTQPEPGPGPVPASDTDEDGILVPRDRCPHEAGVEPDGCPLPDKDKDGVLDEVDKCPSQAGVEPDGCPKIEDLDKDGIPDDVDKCPTEPEPLDGIMDDDGCPDGPQPDGAGAGGAPTDLPQFAGTFEGVHFARGKATLARGAGAALDEAVAALEQHPDVRIEISGHTDSTGGDELNSELSRKRAEAVKAYLVKKGIAADRIQTRGAGPHEPIDTNVTPEGRAKNRRIEFKVLR